MFIREELGEIVINFEKSLMLNNIASCLLERNWKLVTAESCTGGGLAYTLTSIPGSSRWFERGFVTYSNKSKQELLGVSFRTLSHFGTVSYETVTEMAQGALDHSQANVAISISGIAGPGGKADKNIVGTVWFGLASSDYSFAIYQHFQGDREAIRKQSIDFALCTLVNFLENKRPTSYSGLNKYSHKSSGTHIHVLGS